MHKKLITKIYLIFLNWIIINQIKETPLVLLAKINIPLVQLIKAWYKIYNKWKKEINSY
jgi:hypothetical protein